jgi:Lamin Tail Domain
VIAEPSVVISEFMAVNNSTLADEDDANPDWIELYNASTNSVNLDGWYETSAKRV